MNLKILNSKLRENCHEMHNRLTELASDYSWLRLSGDRISPVKHLTIENEQLSKDEVTRILNKIIDHCEENGVALVQAMKVKADQTYNNQTIRNWF